MVKTRVKHLFLTHPNFPNTTSIWTFFKLIEQKFVWARGPNKGHSKIDGFCVGRERHKSGRVHFHTYLRLSRTDHYTSRIGDVSLEGHVYHGNYQRVRSINAVLTYCRKGGDFIEHNLITGFAHTVVKCRNELDVLMALDRATKHRQRSFWTRVYELYREREEHRKRLELTKHIVSFNWYNKFITPETVMGWLRVPDRRPKGLLLAGPSETGKTSFIAKLAGDRPYFIATEPRHFVNYAGEHIVALDEFSWTTWADEIPFLKNVVTGLRVSTPSYYGSRLLATPRIVVICTNENPINWPMPVALRTRFYVFKTDEQVEYRWCDGAWQPVTTTGGDTGE